METIRSVRRRLRAVPAAVALLGIACTAGLLAVAAPTHAAIPPGATVLYDSGVNGEDGFDDTGRFTPGNDLPGEDGGLWQTFNVGGTGPTLLQSTVRTGASGQALRFERLANGKHAHYVDFVTPVDAPAVVVEWDMYVVGTGATPLPYGPFFGIEAKNDDGGAVLGTLYVDATTGELFSTDYQTGQSTGSPIHPDNDFIDQWRHFRMVLDFSTDTFSLYVDYATGATYTETFIDLGFQDVSSMDSADIVAISGNNDPVSDAAAGLAYIDNYVVYTIPEPAALTALAAGALLVTARRRVRAC